MIEIVKLAKAMTKVFAGAAGVSLLLVLVVFVYARLRGPIVLPLSTVNKLASWQSYNETRWSGRGAILVFMEPHDLVPKGERVKLLPPFRSRILGADRALLVYLPPGYRKTGAPAYPLIFALHAFGDRPNNWVHSLLPHLEKGMEAGAVPPAVVVMPDFSLSGNGKTPPGSDVDGRSGSWYVNSNRGRFENHFFEEIVPYAFASFNVRKDRDGIAMLGNSMGGYGALYYGITRPGFCRAVVSIYPAVDLRYSVGGDRLKDYDAAGYEQVTSDDPRRAVMDAGAGMLAVGEEFFFQPVFNSDTRPGAAWKDDLPAWRRMKAVNPVDILRDRAPDLRGTRFYIIAGDRDQLNFDAPLPLAIELLKKAGAKIFPARNIIPGMAHGWWQRTDNRHKQDIIRWLGGQLK